MSPLISSGVKLNEIFLGTVRDRCLVRRIGLFGWGGGEGVAGLMGLFGLDADALRAIRGDPAFSSARYGGTA